MVKCDKNAMHMALDERYFKLRLYALYAII